jgi:hypothetical protein
LPTAVQDWRPLLDRELGRLSERFRAAVVLCDLEGQPRKEAVVRLGVPESTLTSRLTRAHALLARRLRVRGVVLPGAALADGSVRTISSSIPLATLNFLANRADGQVVDQS